jgi:hypothetical protein
MKQNIYSKYWNITYLLLLLLFTLACYWPLTFGIFSPKNDNITQFLPVRFHVSEALRTGHLPLWSPYIYLGYPIHGDMQGGAWNPVVWLLSIFGRYNVTSIRFEILYYIFIAALGMYRLMSAIKLAPILCFTGAAVYLTCGFITDVGGSNLPFLAAAAYTPFVFAYYYQFLITPTWNNTFKSAICLTLLLVSGYPSFFICNCYILLATLLATIFKKHHNKNLKKTFLFQALMVIIFLGLSAPAIFSYWEILPHYKRGSGVGLSNALENSFHPTCSLSFILPGIPIKNTLSYSTDLISRNSYFNLILFVLALCSLWVKKSFFQYFILSGIVFFFLFSLGNYTPVRAWSYNFLPLMNTFRHPSNARLFVIIGGVCLGMINYTNFINGRFNRKILQVILLCLGVGILFFMMASIRSNPEPDKTIFNFQIITRNSLKYLLDNITYNDMLIFNAITQIIFIALFFLLIKKKQWRIKSISIIILVNSFLFAQFTMAYTFVSKVSPSVANKILKEIPSGFPIPDKSKSIAFNSRDALSQIKIIGINSFYDKNIATANLVFTPTFMTLMSKVNNDPLIKSNVLSHSYAYFQENSASFSLHEFWNNQFSFNTVTQKSSVFYLQQLLLPGWKCFIDNKKSKILSANIAFMSVTIPPGEHQVKFIYQPRWIISSVILSALTFLSILGFIIKKLLSAGTK